MGQRGQGPASDLEILTDPEDIERRRQQRLRHLNVVKVPVVRAICFALGLLAVALHNVFILRAFELESFLWLVVITLAYTVASWLLLFRLYGRLGRLDLGILFYVLDLTISMLMIYCSGGESSWLFFIPLMQVITQPHTGLKKAIAFGHLAAIAFLCLMAYLDTAEHRVIDWPTQIAKAGILYASCILAAWMTRIVDVSRERTAEALRLARSEIVERQRAERELRLAEEKYRTLVEQVPAIIYTLDISGEGKQNRRIYHNPQAAEIHGIPLAEAEADPDLWLKQMHPDDSDRVLAEIRRQNALGSSLHLEYRSLTRDGRVLWLENKAETLFDEHGEPRQVQGLISDITEHKRTESELKTLDRIVETINRELDLGRVMETLLEQGLVLLPVASKGTYLARSENGASFEVKVVSGWEPEQLRGVSFSVEEALRRYADEAEPLAEGVFLVRHLDERAGADKVRHVPIGQTLLSLSLTVDGEVVGFLIFDIFGDPEGLRASDLRRLERYRQHAISALAKARVLRQVGAKNQELEEINERLVETSRQLEVANAELRRLSSSDGLTGLANRRHFDSVIDLEWRRARRTRSDLSLLMIDIDAFKSYNDAYGHQAGDDCLRAVAGALREGVSRSTDLIARYGGEEFAVVLPVTGADGALLLARQLCRRVERLGLSHEHSTAADVVTISVGVATATPTNSGSAPASLIAAADEALYRAKAGGRNRVEFGQ